MLEEVAGKEKPSSLICQAAAFGMAVRLLVADAGKSCSQRCSVSFGRRVAAKPRKLVGYHEKNDHIQELLSCMLHSCSNMTLCSVTQAGREARAGESHPGGDNRWSQWQHCQHCLQSCLAVQAEAAPLSPGLHRAQFDTSQDFIFIKWLFLSGSCNLIKYQSGLAVHTQLDTANEWQ